jgi:hypothetical protein
MKKRSLALWAVLFVALFAVLSGGAGCDGGSDSDSSGGGTLSYEDYEGTWKSEDSVSEITISDAEGSNDGFTAHLEGGYGVGAAFQSITGEYTFTRVYAKDVPDAWWKRVFGEVPKETREAIFNELLMFEFEDSTEKKGRVLFTFTEDENETNVQMNKDKIELRFISTGAFNLMDEDYHFNDEYERQE